VPGGDTIALGAPSSPDDTGGIGGLFASAEPAPGPPPPPGGPTAVFAAPQWQPAPDAVAAPQPDPRGGTTRKQVGLVVVAVLLVLAVVVGGGWFLLKGLHRSAGTSATATAPPSTPAATATLRSGAVQRVGGTGFTLEATRVDTSCADHAYDKVAGFFAATDCAGLSRALYSADAHGHAMVLAISKTRMRNAADARRLKALADTSGTGNVSDLLREGVRYAGGPTKLSGSEYASAVDGAVVTIVETAWVSPADKGTATQLDTEAEKGLSLAVDPVPGG
jgi:hypothetical protein